MNVDYIYILELIIHVYSIETGSENLTRLVYDRSWLGYDYGVRSGGCLLQYDPGLDALLHVRFLHQ